LKDGSAENVLRTATGAAIECHASLKKSAPWAPWNTMRRNRWNDIGMLSLPWRPQHYVRARITTAARKSNRLIEHPEGQGGRGRGRNRTCRRTNAGEWHL